MSQNIGREKNEKQVGEEKKETILCSLPLSEWLDVNSLGACRNILEKEIVQYSDNCLSIFVIFSS